MPVAKQVKGKGFYDCISYVLDKDEKEILESNLSGKTPSALNKKFELCCRLNQKVRFKVYHATISFPPEDEVDDKKLKAIAHDYLYGMGFGEEQPDLEQLEKEERIKDKDKMFGDKSLAVPYLVVRHDDTENKHIHIVAGRVRHDGSCVSSYWDYRKSEQVLRMLEDYHGLSSPQGAIALKELRQILDRCREECTNFDDLKAMAGEQNVNVYSKNNGIVYGYKEKHYKGNTLGAKYTLQGMSKVLYPLGLDKYDNPPPRLDIEDKAIRAELETHRDTLERILREEQMDNFKGKHYEVQRNKKSLIITKIDNPEEKVKWVKPAPTMPWILSNFKFTEDTFNDFSQKMRTTKENMEEVEKDRLKKEEAVRKQQEIQGKLAIVGTQTAHPSNNPAPLGSTNRRRGR
ncbi:relaxase/mobilization nuclease domain-containing protein (plasmid) [Cyanobacterium sp. IPPAS B-1200]|uniref:relaxase/mobilization nuclease domain-containing protein n=1 Tax=Cyanobacterium sp. IPPAS B-1200 TaxID=1562720 RepID=UPI003D3FC821